MYNHKQIEKKWREYWEDNEIFKTNIKDFGRPKYYVLDMFPYTSGDGLHVGHAEGYTATDIISRMKRMQGYNVLHPMGFDSFGLPSEQYAIKTGNNPDTFTRDNIKRFSEQLKKLGYDFDWSKTIITCDKSYYKWTQWIFKQMYLDGLVEYADTKVNWCEELGTVLANDEIIDGKSERGGYPVIKKNMKQWVIKIPNYAEKLLNGLDIVDFPSSTKEMQKNWIGKLEGINIKFKIENTNLTLEVFTPKPYEIYGSTYCLISPSNPLLKQIVTKDKENVVNHYINSTEEANKEINGVFTGRYAINPINNKKIPIWISNLCNYDKTAYMGVPCRNKLDNKFAEKYHIEIIKVIDENNCLINSESLNGLSINDANNIMNKWLVTRGLGYKTTTYKLKNWIFARQRYWGEPIPLVHMEDGSIKILEDASLPLELPTMTDYKAKNGKPPLENAVDWKNVTVNGQKGKRETCTMPGSAASSWYYLRYIDPNNDEIFANYELLKHWMPVDLYFGGSEHTVGHLLYSRMWNSYLYDKGLVPYKEPFNKLRHPGMILGSDNEKMSKSKGNVVNPDSVIEEYGADALRLYLMFMGPINTTKAWNENGLKSARKFLDKIWNFFSDSGKLTLKETPNLEKIYHETIKKVTNDYENMNFNTAISQLMIFFKTLVKENQISLNYALGFLKLLNPITPFITEEINKELLKSNQLLALSEWPKHNENLLINEQVDIIININNKKAKVLTCKKDISEKELLNLIYEDKSFNEFINESEIKNIYFIPNRIINIITKQKVLKK